MECGHREVGHQQQLKQMQEQMETMQTWVERSISRENEHAGRAQNQDQLKLTKLTESEDIESYLAMFERTM